MRRFESDWKSSRKSVGENEIGNFLYDFSFPFGTELLIKFSCDYGKQSLNAEWRQHRDESGAMVNDILIKTLRKRSIAV